MGHLLGNHGENLARLFGGGALHGIVARQVLEAAFCPLGESETVNETNEELVGVDQGANRLEMGELKFIDFCEKPEEAGCRDRTFQFGTNSTSNCESVIF